MESANFNSDCAKTESLKSVAESTIFPIRMRYVLQHGHPELVFGHRFKTTRAGLTMIEYHGTWEGDLEETEAPPYRHLIMALGDDNYWRLRGQDFQMLHLRMVSTDLGSKVFRHFIKNPTAVTLTDLNGLGRILERPSQII